MRFTRTNVLLAFAASLGASAALANVEKRHPRGLVVPKDAEYGVPFLSWNDIAEGLPETLDLREAGFVSPVKNQGSCGSCWAFAGAAVMETALLRDGGSPVNLSEQQLVSCDRNSYGCGGGFSPFEYMKVRGIGLEDDFPYAGRNLSCKTVAPVAKVSRWGYLGSANRRATVEEVRKAIHDFGALWVSVAADSSWDRPTPVNTRCSNANVTHAVTMVGYEKTESDKFHFIIKNSWGNDWNGDGYIKSELGCDNLGRHISFMVPEGSACSPPEFGLSKKLILKGGGEIKAPGLDAAGLSYDVYRVGHPMPIGQPRRIGAGESGDYVVRTQNECGNWEMMVHVKT